MSARTASIRPRPHGRGDPIRPCGFLYPLISFNSATASWPWRWGVDVLVLGFDVPLQFGHGLMAVEIPGAQIGCFGAASLQFGHGLMAVEMARVQRSRSAVGWLQFGHGLMAVEI